MTSLPEWRKAWRLDDPAWVNQRKAEWKRINKEIVEKAVAIVNSPDEFEPMRVEAAGDLLRCLAETDLQWDELKAALIPFLTKTNFGRRIHLG